VRSSPVLRQLTAAICATNTNYGQSFAIFAALSLMIGAFVASAAAAYGGNVRDEF
jgi:hypothetical protein